MNKDKRRVVIVGGGFGGMEVAKRLRHVDVCITLVDRRNYHLFQPLLYQVATGGLSPANIATPLRSILRSQANCEVALAEVTDFDLANRRLQLADGELSFDELVVAAGATHSYFGNDQWREFAPGLKTLTDATDIRRRVFLAFEAAERETNLAIRQALMTFVIIGGGPTGVELAGALSEIATHTLKRDFRHITPGDARILIVEAANNVLSFYPNELCQRAADQIRALGIEVLTQTRVTDITADYVRVATTAGETSIPTRTVLWAAGVQANPLAKKLAAACGVDPDRAGRIPVTPQLTVAGHEHVFVIGDIASCVGVSGKLLPGLATVAIQQGRYVAKMIAGRVSGNTTSEPFDYHDRGTMATIGRASAVAMIGKRQFSGFFAWILWLLVHLIQIVQFQNRILVLLQWAWSYATFNRSARLITGEERVIIVHHQQIASSAIAAENR